MRNEQRTIRLEFGARNLECGVFNHRAHELLNSTAFLQFEGEKRGNRYFDFMPQILQPLKRSQCASTRCDGDEIIIGEFFQGCNFSFLEDANAVSLAKGEEQMDDGVRVLRTRKNTLVGLNRQCHTMTFKPAVCISGRKRLEKTFQQSVSTRIDLTQVADFGKGVRAVATSPTTHFHFREHALPLLVDVNLHLRNHFLEIDGEEKTSSSSSNDGCFHLVRKFKESRRGSS